MTESTVSEPIGANAGEPDTASSQCFHCGEPTGTSTHWRLTFEGQSRSFCCPGCFLIAETIIDSGQGHFYRYRTAYAEKPDFVPNALPDTLKESLTLYDQAQHLNEHTQLEADGNRSVTLIVEGISCAACGWLIEKQLSQLLGVLEVSLNLSTHRAFIHWDANKTPLSRLIEACYRIGFAVRPFSQADEAESREQENKQSLKRLLIAGIGTMQAMMFSVPLYVGAFKGIADEFSIWLRLGGLIITTTVVLFASMSFFRAAWRSLKAFHLSMDVPVSLAILTAYFASLWSTLNQGPEVYFDSICMFTFFLLLGRHLEMKARHKANNASQALMDYTPDTAYRIDTGKPQLISTQSIRMGDHLLVKPGSRIPADGYLTKGASWVDESIVTGESFPVSKQPGDQVIAGALNTESPIEMRVSKVGQQTQLSTIARLQEKALSEKPTLAALSDTIAHYFVMAVLITAAAVFTFWHWVKPEEAFWITLSVLVVTCPCALSLATPTVLTVAAGWLREKGMLIVKGHALETLAQIKHLAFDKTGTLTQADMRIRFERWHSKHQAQRASWINLCKRMEATSEHPIAKAFAHYPDNPLPNTQKPASSMTAEPTLKGIQNYPGYGIEAHINDERLRLGRREFVAELFAEAKSIPLELQDSTLYLGSNLQGWIAGFDLTDPLRPDASTLISLLKRQGYFVAVFSGDTQENVEQSLTGLAVDEMKGELSPSDKVHAIKALQTLGPVLMMGDGVNDAPVLAQADISIAIGEATDFAKASADMILTSTQLTSVAEALAIAKRSQRIIKQNFAWALLYNLLALPLAAMGYIAPWAAAIGMSASSLLVVMNALRLRRVSTFRS